MDDSGRFCKCGACASRHQQLAGGGGAEIAGSLEIVFELSRNSFYPPEQEESVRYRTDTSLSCEQSSLTVRARVNLCLFQSYLLRLFTVILASFATLSVSLFELVCQKLLLFTRPAPVS